VASRLARSSLSDEGVASDGHLGEQAVEARAGQRHAAAPAASTASRPDSVVSDPGDAVATAVASVRPGSTS
jgi:hypothetical protein